MPECFREVASSSPSQAPGSYVYSILPTIGDRLATLTSADELLVLDKTDLQSVSRLHDEVPKSVSCMTGSENAEQTVVCAGGDGVVAVFDVRTERRVFHFQTDRAVSALAQYNHEVAVGSELSHSQAAISIWDIRRGKRRWQSTENSDDITALQYHPSNHTHLLSGGDDGLVSIFDTSIQDENDSLLQAFDHGPIHKAGFLSDQDIYALSSDQRLTIYPVEDSEVDGSVVIQPAVLGDLRSKAQCNYVIDVLSDIRQPYVITGSNLSNPHVDFIPLATTPNFSLSRKTTIRIQGAHGEEIVRSVYLDKSAQTIFTAGEDGCVKAFRASQELRTSSPPAKSMKEGDKGKTGRFKPY